MIYAVSKREEEACASEIGMSVVYRRVLNLRAAVFSDHDQVIVAIPGSDDLADWISNFDSRLEHVVIRRKNMVAHRGAVHNALALYPFVAGSVYPFVAKHEQDIIIAGHSAGGQIAEILGAAMSATVYTFGAPRVFSQASAVDLVATKRYRFTNQRDPIPSLPLRKFRWLFGGASFAHASPELHLEGNGDIITDRKERSFLNLFTRSWWDLWRRRLPLAIHDHHMTSYIEALEKKV
jgi:hypothetical protein